MISAQQSPINIEHPYVTNLGPRRLTINWLKGGSCNVKGTVKCGDHGLKISFPFVSANSIKLDGRTFVLSEFHFHFPTEHYVNAKPVSGAMELHIVHQNPDDASLAVLGVFIRPKSSKKSGDGEAGDQPNMLVQYLDQVRTRCQAKGAAHKYDDNPIEISTDACDWIPTGSGLTHYYRYEGSLTTAPFTETVSWVVFDDILKVIFPGKDWADLKKGFGHAARPIQPLNRRLVLCHNDACAVPAVKSTRRKR